LIEKDGETMELLKHRRDLLFRGGSDKALELLLQTADTLKHECHRLREQNWKLEMQHTQHLRLLEGKSKKIKDSKSILKKNTKA
jgi:hypothetical protein